MQRMSQDLYSNGLSDETCQIKASVSVEKIALENRIFCLWTFLGPLKTVTTHVS